MKTDIQLVDNVTATHPDGREVVLGKWSDGSVSLTLPGGRFLLYDINDRCVWERMGTSLAMKQLAGPMTVDEFITKYTEQIQ